ncbi:unnamed protein product [Rangifer tarandus platyrhynchus]|uniref:Uncharacterized protein n=1 Tax=Rangifer tarandus platyrhynchus TaxID=3082113 RepID=A0ABN8YM21_RANTA|nr:unnamed protein product [Rangifer tarandus platyrhynchus]
MRGWVCVTPDATPAEEPGQPDREKRGGCRLIQSCYSLSVSAVVNTAGFPLMLSPPLEVPEAPPPPPRDSSPETLRLEGGGPRSDRTAVGPLLSLLGAIQCPDPTDEDLQEGAFGAALCELARLSLAVLKDKSLAPRVGLEAGLLLGPSSIVCVRQHLGCADVEVH